MFLDSTGFPFCMDWNLVSACSPVFVLYQSLDCFVVVVICGCADNGSVRHWVLCVFCRKYMCGVEVLDKGCGAIFNVLSTSSLMSFTFTWCMCLRWCCCWCVWHVLFGCLVDFCVEFCVYLF